MPIASETYDVSVWYLLSNDFLKGLGIYSSYTYTYPPLWAYTILPLIRILAILVNPAIIGLTPDNLAGQGILPGTLQTVVSPLFLILLKLPLLLADLSAGYLIYRIVIVFAGWSRGKAAVALWLLSPSIIWTSFGHGQFDVIPAVLTLASAYLLYRRQMMSSGFALSLAVIYKLYPLFFVPLYFAAIIVQRGNGGVWRNQLLRLLVGLIVPAVIFLLVPLFLPPSGASFLSALGAREGLLSSFGGFSPLGLVDLPQLFAVHQWMILNSGLVNILILSLESALSVLIAWRLKRPLVSDRFSAILYGHVFILVAIFLTSPLTNPQYMVWILPFLTLLYGLKGEYFKRSWILSVVGFLFNLIWLGPGYFFYPSALFLGVPSVASLVAFNTAFVAVSLPTITLCQFVGFAAIFSCLKPRFPWTQREGIIHAVKSPSPQVAFDSKLPKRMGRALALGAIFLVASMGFVAFNSTPSFTVAPSYAISNYTVIHNSTYLHAQAQLHLSAGTYAAEINSLLIPLRTLPNQPPIYIYYDASYPTSLTDIRGWKGLTDHLPFELQQRNYSSNTTLVNAQRLASILATDTGDIIVTASGTLPSTTDITALKSFIQRGGTLFWIGDRIGYYTTGSALALNRDSPMNLGYNAQRQLFNGVIVQSNASSLSYVVGQRQGPYSAGDLTTNLSRTLDLNYPETTVGIDLTNLTRLGGTALGRINTHTNQTSLALIPIGQGKLVLFGGGITNQFASSGEVTVASDIAQMLSSNVLDTTFEDSFLSMTLNPWESINVTLDLSLKTTESIAGILFITYSPYADISFFAQRTYLP
jgi:glycosyl transferase family 87